MSQTTVIANNVTLGDLRQKFNLRRTSDRQFFTEWFNDLPELTDLEQESLNQVKADYLYQIEDGPLPEGAVKMIVASPLLKLAGFYQPPFRIHFEESVQITVQDQNQVLRGRIDALVVQDQLWVLVVEAKRTGGPMELAVPQALAYMLGTPRPEQPVFGFITNGGSFLFLKLSLQDVLEYDLSSLFSLLPLRNELHDVLRVLKRISQLITAV